MKNLFKVLAIALVAVIGFSFAACGGGDDGNPQTATYTGTSGGQTYTLKITENTARYTAQSGDDYELTDGSKKSAGTVDSVSGSVLTLKPSNATITFTATVSGSNLTELNDTITWTDNTTTAAPGTFTGGTNPDTGSGGTFTVTDIPSKYNGKYAAFVDGNANSNDPSIVGYQSISNGDMTYSRISNGTVSIPAWLSNKNEKTVVRYSGNDTFDIGFSIYDASTMDEYLDDPSGKGLAIGIFYSVKFSNGSTTKKCSDADIFNGK